MLYTVRNLWARKLTTALTAVGMALVVYVFATVLMLSEGLQKTLVDTGTDGNAITLRRGSETEVQSSIERSQAAIVESLPQIAVAPTGQHLLSKETVVLVTLPKRRSDKPSNVTLRGTSAAGVALRPQVRITAGRMFNPGTAEIIAGQKIAGGFAGAGLGEALYFARKTWRVVGVFDAGNTAFGSEIWGDVDQFMQAFRRNTYSTVLLRLNGSAEFQGIRQRIEQDPRLTLEVKQERRFYAEQSATMARFLRVFGITLSVIFSIGAVIGAMITMYASVASRITEIGTLRALGFSRPDILAAFVLEALLIGLTGGALGVFVAAFMQFVTISTMNWQTFSELSFSFTLTPSILARSIGFALIMGLAGGALPALRAARLPIVDALRAS